MNTALYASRRTDVNPAIAAWMALTLLLVSGAPSRAAHQDAEDYAQTFKKIWRTTRDHFYDPEMGGLNWRATGDRYHEKATAARSKQEFQTVVNQMLSELHASHLAYWTDDDLEFYLLQSLFSRESGMQGFQAEHIGVMGERENGVYVVRAILDGGPAVRAGVQTGDRLLEAEGRPFSTVGAFRGWAGQSVKLTLERPGRGRMTVEVTPVRENPQRAFLNAMRRSVRVIERGGRRVGYIHLWCMTNDRFRQALEEALTDKLARTDGLVLDLRDGFGGNPFRFTDVLFRPDVEWTDIARGKSKRATHTAYAKPLVVIINHGTRSAKEFFAYQIKKSGRGTLVGTPTAGAFLGAAGFPISPEGFLELPAVDLMLDGKRLEGVGVAPDVPVEAQDAYGPDDRQVARAVDVLLAKLRGAALEAGSEETHAADRTEDCDDDSKKVERLVLQESDDRRERDRGHVEKEPHGQSSQSTHAGARAGSDFHRRAALAAGHAQQGFAYPAAHQQSTPEDEEPDPRGRRQQVSADQADEQGG